MLKRRKFHLLESLRADVQALLSLFIERKDPTYLGFLKCWKELHFSHIHLLNLKRINYWQYLQLFYADLFNRLSNKSPVIPIFLENMNKNIQILLVNVFVVFATYTLYMTQKQLDHSIQALQPIRITASYYQLLELYVELFSSHSSLAKFQFAYDVSQIIGFLIQNKAFLISSSVGPIGLESLFSVAPPSIIEDFHEWKKFFDSVDSDSDSDSDTVHPTINMLMPTFHLTLIERDPSSSSSVLGSNTSSTSMESSSATLIMNKESTETVKQSIAQRREKYFQQQREKREKYKERMLQKIGKLKEKIYGKKTRSRKGILSLLTANNNNSGNTNLESMVNDLTSLITSLPSENKPVVRKQSAVKAEQRRGKKTSDAPMIEETITYLEDENDDSSDDDFMDSIMKEMTARPSITPKINATMQRRPVATTITEPTPSSHSITQITRRKEDRDNHLHKNKLSNFSYDIDSVVLNQEEEERVEGDEEEYEPDQLALAEDLLSQLNASVNFVMNTYSSSNKKKSREEQSIIMNYEENLVIPNEEEIAEAEDDLDIPLDQLMNIESLVNELNDVVENVMGSRDITTVSSSSTSAKKSRKRKATSETVSQGIDNNTQKQPRTRKPRETKAASDAPKKRKARENSGVSRSKKAKLTNTIEQSDDINDILTQLENTSATILSAYQND